MTAPPLVAAVLVPAKAAPFWRVLHANGDTATAREKAEAWSAHHPGAPAVLVHYADHVEAAIKTSWARGKPGAGQ